MSDLQSRLQAVEKRCKEIEAEVKNPVLSFFGPTNSHIAELAYYVSYLSIILQKHLETGEALPDKCPLPE